MAPACVRLLKHGASAGGPLETRRTRCRHRTGGRDAALFERQAARASSPGCSAAAEGIRRRQGFGGQPAAFAEGWCDRRVDRSAGRRPVDRRIRDWQPRTRTVRRGHERAGWLRRGASVGRPLETRRARYRHRTGGGDAALFERQAPARVRPDALARRRECDRRVDRSAGRRPVDQQGRCLSRRCKGEFAQMLYRAEGSATGGSTGLPADDPWISSSGRPPADDLWLSSPGRPP